MKRWVNYLVGVSAVLSDTAILCAFFYTFGTLQTGQYTLLHPVSLGLGGLILFTVNFFLLRAPRSMGLLGTVDGLLAVGGGALALLAGSRLAGWSVYAMAVVFIIIVLGRSIYHSLHEIPLTHQMTFIDLTVFSLLWYCLIIEGGKVPNDGVVIGFVTGVFLLDIVAAVARRGAGQKTDTVCGSRGKGTALFGGMLALVAGGILLLVRLFAKSSQTLVDSVLHGTAAGFKALGGLLNRLAAWFFSLFPVPEIEGEVVGMEQPAMGEMGGDTGSLSVDMRMVIGVLAVLAAAAVVVGIVLLVRFRRTKLGSLGGHIPAAANTRRRNGALRRRLAALKEALRFRLLALVHRSTPAGTFVWLTRWGSRHGLERQPGQTPRSYAAGLVPLVAEADRPEAEEALERLCAVLDETYFAGRRATYPAAESRALRRLFPAGKPEKTDKPDEKNKPDEPDQP